MAVRIGIDADGGQAPGILKLERLSQAGFSDFGDVIETQGREFHLINGGKARRYHGQATVELAGGSGLAGITLVGVDAHASTFPLCIKMLERHPLSSQSWIPRNQVPFVIVVAPNGADGLPDETRLRAFFAEGNQGINYRTGVWHHPLLTVGNAGEFVVVDRMGDILNCDERILKRTYLVDASFGD